MPLRRCERWAFRHENLVMSAKNPVADKGTAVVADDWKETLKSVGGSQSDDWNHVLGNQAIQSLWIKQSSVPRDKPPSSANSVRQWGLGKPTATE
jgi:hypothetical protein